MRSFLLVLLAFCNVTGYAQNLLVNGSFEDENICTEYSQNCAPEAWICNSLTANYYFDIGTWAFEGRHFVGLIAGSNRRNAVRTFVRSRLPCGLRKGNQYRISFYIRSRHDIYDSLGVLFSATDFLFDKRPYQQIAPSLLVEYRRDPAESDPFNWKRFSFLYTATGDERFITIGSFKKLEHRFQQPAEINGNYYFYIDSVSCIPANIHELPCTGIDSLTAVIYNENERHKLLDKKIAFLQRNIPDLPIPPITVLQKIDTLIIPDILFSTASARLNEKSYQVLDSFCTALHNRNVDSILVEGHTDSIGTQLYNRKLSADRAAAVSGYIHDRAESSINGIVVRFFDFSRPIASNQTSQGRQRNRRVEIYLYTHE